MCIPRVYMAVFSVLSKLKNRGLKDIFALRADGLSGIKEATAALFPIFPDFSS